MHPTHLIFLELITLIILPVEAFWAVTSCSAVVGYHHFRSPCCLHLQANLDLWNVNVLPHHHTASQPRRWR